MTNQFVFPRHCQLDLPTAVAGDGCFLIDDRGRRYLDASGGAAVSCLGHSDQSVTRAVMDQVKRLSFAHTSFFTSDAAEALAERLAGLAPAGGNKVYLVSGGSEAVEAAIKLARQYFLEIGQPQRHRIISRRQSYHGNTLGALAAGGNQWRRHQFEPLLTDVSLIAPCYAYRDKLDDESEEEYGLRIANELEAEILALGPDQVMAFLAEPVVGATAGVLASVPGYFARIREICDQYGVLLILDEVMCGMGRTGTLFACDHDDVTPDILTIAKGLGAGYQPIGAMLCQDRIYDAVANGSGFFQHGHTYSGHPVACAAAGAVLSRIVDDGLGASVAAKGKDLMTKLTAALGQHPHIGDLRGRGLFIGLELVKDRQTKTPFDPDERVAARMKQAAMAEGMMCYPGQGTIDGRRGDHILLAPPFIISTDEIDMLVERLTEAFHAVF